MIATPAPRRAAPGGDQRRRRRRPDPWSRSGDHGRRRAAAARAQAAIRCVACANGTGQRTRHGGGGREGVKRSTVSDRGGYGRAVRQPPRRTARAARTGADGSGVRPGGALPCIARPSPSPRAARTVASRPACGPCSPGAAAGRDGTAHRRSRHLRSRPGGPPSGSRPALSAWWPPARCSSPAAARWAASRAWSCTSRRPRPPPRSGPRPSRRTCPPPSRVSPPTSRKSRATPSPCRAPSPSATCCAPPTPGRRTASLGPAGATA